MHDVYTGSYLTIQAARTSAVINPFLIKCDSHTLADQRLRYCQNKSTTVHIHEADRAFADAWWVGEHSGVVLRGSSPAETTVGHGRDASVLLLREWHDLDR